MFLGALERSESLVYSAPKNSKNGSVFVKFQQKTCVYYFTMESTEHYLGSLSSFLTPCRGAASELDSEAGYVDPRLEYNINKPQKVFLEIFEFSDLGSV